MVAETGMNVFQNFAKPCCLILDIFAHWIGATYIKLYMLLVAYDICRVSMN